MAITTFTKHLIYEYAITKLFDNIMKNIIYPTVLKVGKHYNNIKWKSSIGGDYGNITCNLYNCFISAATDYEYIVDFEYGIMTFPVNTPYEFYRTFTYELVNQGYMLTREEGKLIIKQPNGMTIPYNGISDWKFE